MHYISSGWNSRSALQTPRGSVFDYDTVLTNSKIQRSKEEKKMKKDMPNYWLLMLLPLLSEAALSTSSPSNRAWKDSLTNQARWEKGRDLANRRRRHRRGLENSSRNNESNSSPYYAPGDASWLGDYGSGEDIPPIESFLPYLYFIYGHEGVPIARIITGMDDECPVISCADDADGQVDVPEVKVRGAVGNTTLPFAFPIQICEAYFETIDQRNSWNDGRIYFNEIDSNVKLPSDPKTFALIGDTGLRIKPSGYGIEGCNQTSKVYNIRQCDENFTQATMDVDTVTGTGEYQSLENWPLKTTSDHVATLSPDVVVHIGDFLYRQGSCPETGNPGCVSINAPVGFTERDLDGLTMNFLPGYWGDNLYGWWADFLYPAHKLLQQSPMIAARGNHENCDRGGYGYEVFLSPYPYSNSPLGSDCNSGIAPWSVPFEKEQFVVVSANDVEQLDDQDGFEFRFEPGKCPSAPGPDEPPLVAVNSSLFKADKFELASNQIEEQSRYMKMAEEMLDTYETNFLVTHRPLFGIVCNYTDIVSFDWTLQQSLGQNTLDNVVMTFAGHQHLAEAIVFRDDTLPTQLIVGNGGTKLEEVYIDPDSIPGVVMQAGRDDHYQGVVERGFIDSSHFGFTMMEWDDENDEYKITFNFLNPDTQQFEAKDDFLLAIQQGPRVKNANPSSAPSNENNDPSSAFPSRSLSIRSAVTSAVTVLFAIVLFSKA